MTDATASLAPAPIAHVPGFRPVPRTGVIYVMDRARELGYGAGAEGWCNLGQGQPETGPLPGAPSRPADVQIAADDYEYAPVGGIDALRRAVANLYNTRYRQGKRRSTARKTSASVVAAGLRSPAWSRRWAM